MKTVLQTWLALSMALFSFGVNAKNANDLLNDVVDHAQDVESHSKQAERTLNSFAKSYFVLGNTNTDINAFVSAMESQMTLVETSADGIINFAQQAATANQGLDVSGLIAKGNQIKTLKGQILNDVAVIRSALNAGNVTLAKTKVTSARAALVVQYNAGMQVANNAASLEAYFKVRIKLVDRFGQVYTLGQTGLGGYAAKDHATNQYIYPGQGNQEEFLNLNPGTYTFDAYNGYFDGAQSKTVTLSNSLVGADGYIEVVLRYWSE